MFRLIIVVAAFAAVAGLWVIDRDGAPSWLAPYTPAWLGPDAAGLAEDDLAEDDVAADRTDNSVPRETASSDGSSDAFSGNDRLRINDAGLQIIKDSEGLRLEAYSAGGKSYIGYGRQRKPGDPARITEAQATEFLREDVAVAEAGVRRVITRQANENEFSAMVSLAYNLGTGAFSRSEVVTKFNAGDKPGAADAFRNHNTAGGAFLQRLADRREKERTLFLTPA
ncbi:MAG: lysozyme [Pseudomonadota bacterium]